MTHQPPMGLSRHMAKDFGEVHRSSAIFQVFEPSICKSEFLLFDYWRHKNGVQADLTAHWRTRDGRTVQIQEIDLATSSVHRLTAPSVEAGSVEFSAISRSNLRVPYAAVMAKYATPRSACLVHAYARTLNASERTGSPQSFRETCWTMPGDPGLTPVAFTHNGPGGDVSTTITVEARTAENHALVSKRHQLQSFETMEFSDLAREASSEIRRPGARSLTVALQACNAFSRLLCGNLSTQFQEIQLSHSYFELSDSKEPGGPVSVFPLPKIAQAAGTCSVRIYETAPREFAPYLLEDFANKSRWRIEPGNSLEIPSEHIVGGGIRIRSERGMVPSRLSIGLVIRGASQRIPAELVVGAICSLQAPKFYHWAPIDYGLNPTLDVVTYEDHFGPPDPDDMVHVELFGAGTHSPVRRSVAIAEILALAPLPVPDLFPDLARDTTDLAYLAIKTNYPGFQFFVGSHVGTNISTEHFF